MQSSFGIYERKPKTCLPPMCPIPGRPFWRGVMAQCGRSQRLRAWLLKSQVSPVVAGWIQLLGINFTSNPPPGLTAIRCPNPSLSKRGILRVDGCPRYHKTFQRSWTTPIESPMMLMQASSGLNILPFAQVCWETSTEGIDVQGKINYIT